MLGITQVMVILALYRRQLDLFQLREDVSPLIQKASEVLLEHVSTLTFAN